jgi:hypothetical protein
MNGDDDRREDAYAIQRAFYTKYGKKWGMKTQLLFCPDGMIGSVFFTSIAQNDRGVVNLSGIEVILKNALEEYRLEHGE